MQDYTKLEIWKTGIEISISVYKLCEAFPKTEQFGLVSQMQRASVSISSNIAEGTSRRSQADFIRFLEIALGSCFELESQLILSERIGFIKNPELSNEISLKLQSERKMIYAFIQKLK